MCSLGAMFWLKPTRNPPNRTRSSAAACGGFPKVNVCEHARTDAYLMTLEHAAQLGANAIIGFGYDTTEVYAGMTEVLAYGTAVVVEPESAVPSR